MSIWNKVLSGSIIFFSLIFFYMAARTLKTHQYWRQLAHKQEQRIAELRKENQELFAGSEDGTKLGVKQLQSALDELIVARNRGRVWYGCQPQQPNAQTGDVRVVIEKPEPHAVAVKTVLYVFEQTETPKAVGKGGQYLGQFVVEAVDAKQVALKPAREMSLPELQRLAKSKGPWAMYELMPVDQHDAFAGLSDDEKKQILPPETLADYLKDGQPATWEQMAEWGVTGTLVDDAGKALIDEKTGEKKAGAKGTFVRQLRDYQSLFQWYDLERTRLFNLAEEGERDKKYMRDAADDAKKDVAFRRNEIETLKDELNKCRAEQEAVAAHDNALKQTLAALQAAVRQTISTNQALASQIAKIQLDASRRIDQQLRVMIQSGEGRK